MSGTLLRRIEALEQALSSPAAGPPLDGLTDLELEALEAWHEAEDPGDPEEWVRAWVASQEEPKRGKPTLARSSPVASLDSEAVAPPSGPSGVPEGHGSRGERPTTIRRSTDPPEPVPRLDPEHGVWMKKAPAVARWFFRR